MRGRPNAMHSLFGGKVSRERERFLLLNGGKALSGNVGGQERRQTVLTSQWFLQQLIQNAKAPIGYDPCTTKYNPCKAKVFSTEETNGLKVNWAKQSAKHGWVYLNPPYGGKVGTEPALKIWMRKAFEECERGMQGYMLAPFRPWRTWFCEYIPSRWIIGEGRIVVSLAPLAFVGEKQAYPAPLCIIPYNMPIPTIVNLKGKNMVTGLWDARRAA